MGQQARKPAGRESKSLWKIVLRMEVTEATTSPLKYNDVIALCDQDKAKLFAKLMMVHKLGKSRMAK